MRRAVRPLFLFLFAACSSVDDAPLYSGPSIIQTDCASPAQDLGQVVCQTWKCNRLDLKEGSFTGNVATCNAEDVLATGRDNALRLVNMYRSLANLPAVTMDAQRNQKAQQCALMMTANGALSHTPPNTWKCYTPEGAEAAMHSNISDRPAVGSIAGYMRDDGNSTTIGHRRWILSNALDFIGIGSTDPISGFSCMWVVGNGSGTKEWVAWPPPGPFPFDIISDIHSTGWTLQSDVVDLSSAQVQVTEGATSLPVTVSHLQDRIGSQWAIGWIGQGWVAEKGKSYRVQISGVAKPISYIVQVVDCI